MKDITQARTRRERVCMDQNLERKFSLFNMIERERAEREQRLAACAVLL